MRSSALPFLLAATLASPAALAAEGHAHWSYEGHGAPEHWGDLSPEFALCKSGTAQSPIDITQPAPQDLANIAFHYQPSKINILNNGHTIQVNYDAGSYIELDGSRYELAQFHLHAPSEHAINGKLAAAEVHLVHKSAEGKLAVVGVMLEEGSENAAYAPVFAAMPEKESPVATVPGSVEGNALLPEKRTTFRYAGSLTTPPCSEGVKWNVMTTPVQLSKAQLAAFTKIFSGNNRPVQPLNARELMEDSTP